MDLAPLSLLSVNLIVHQWFRLWEKLSQLAQMVARCVNQSQLFSVSGDLCLERRRMRTQNQEREVLILAVPHELNSSGRGTDVFQGAGGAATMRHTVNTCCRNRRCVVGVTEEDPLGPKGKIVSF